MLPLLTPGLSEGVVERRILKPLWKGFPSERWLLPDDDRFSAAYKTRLLTLIAERFKVATDADLPPNCPPDRARDLRLKKNRELFYLIHHAVGETSPRPLTFNAHYGLFRALLTMFALLAVLALVGSVWALCFHPVRLAPFVLWTGFFTGAALIAYVRCRKRSEDFANPSSTFSSPAQPATAPRRNQHDPATANGPGAGDGPARPSHRLSLPAPRRGGWRGGRQAASPRTKCAGAENTS